MKTHTDSNIFDAPVNFTQPITLSGEQFAFAGVTINAGTTQTFTYTVPKAYNPCKVLVAFSLAYPGLLIKEGNVEVNGHVKVYIYNPTVGNIVIPTCFIYLTVMLL